MRGILAATLNASRLPGVMQAADRSGQNAPMPSPLPTEPPSSAPSGLTHAEAQARLQRDGPNELPQGERRTLWRIVLGVVREPMFQLLVAAGLIYLVLGDMGEALILLGFVIVTMSITIVQEQRTERMLDTLRDLSSPRALVVREGQRRRIAAREVVSGDVVVLSEGERVPADARLFESHGLHTNESLLTGEPVPVRKQAAGADAPISRPGGDDLPWVYSATLVVKGSGLAEVTATGERSEVGRIGQSLAEISDDTTPLHRQTGRLVRVMSVLGLGVSVLVVLLYGLTGKGWLDGLLAGITIAMSMLPEEFPVVLTAFMTVGAWRISKARVLTRRAATIEALGSATVLCTDKTGTLTMNEMEVAALAVDGKTWRAGAAELPEDFHRLLEYGVLASERDGQDPMEQALHRLAQAHLSGTEHLHAEWLLAHEYGLSPEMLAMSHVWRMEQGQRHLIATKGAPEAVADLCHLDAARLAQLRQQTEALAAQGMRVLGVAVATHDGTDWPGTQHDFDFSFIGLIGLADPLRPGVVQAVQECRNAGLRVAMITGDYPATALAIARQAGIATEGGVLSGDEIQALADDALRERVAQVSVYARVMPEQKLRIVNALKANGSVVAMTGDGVNDAPSLRAAHIGVAMGKRGTDVAREASDLVLLDDDFGAIVKAVRLGRRIYDNLRKAMTFIVAVHVPIAGLALLPLFFGWPVIFTPIHIAFLELVIDPVCSIVFEAEPDERDLMERPPRDPQAPLFSVPMLVLAALQGLLVLAVVAGGYAWLLASGVQAESARAAAFIALVACNFALVLTNRSFSASVIAALVRPNRAFWITLAVASSLLAAAVFIEPARELFRFGPLTGLQLAVAAGSGVALTLLLSGFKQIASVARQRRATA